MFDAELIPVEEHLNDVESKMFRSALGICLYIAQERLDIQQIVRVLSSFTWVALQRLLCVLCGSLEVTWCRPRT